MIPPTRRTFIFLIAGILLLTACAPAAAPAPTVDPAEIQRQVQQIVALTVAAQNALTEQAQAAQPTNTPLPTQTEAPLLPSPTPLQPTATLIILPSPTPGSSSGSGNVPPPPKEYACAIVNQSPANYSVWKRNKEFDITWTLVNTGTKPWRAGSDLVFKSGTNFATTTFVELPAVPPGGKHKVILDAVTPSKAGTYTMVWKLEGGFCLPSLIIKVE